MNPILSQAEPNVTIEAILDDLIASVQVLDDHLGIYVANVRQLVNGD